MAEWMNSFYENRWAIAFVLISLWFLGTILEIREDFAKYWDYIGNPYTPDGKKLYFVSPMTMAIGTKYPFLANFMGYQNKQTPIFFYMLMTQFGTVVNDDGTLTPYQMFNGIAPSDEMAKIYTAPTASGFWPPGSDRTAWVNVLNALGAKVNPDGTPMPVDPQWETNKNNFLFQEYGINGNSNMIVKFLNGSDRVTFQTLMGEWGGTPSMESGFMGLMEYNNQTWGAFDAYNYVFGTVPTQNPKSKQKCSGNDKAAAGVGVATAMIGPTGVGAMFGPEGAAVGAVIGLGLGLFEGFTNPNPCKRL